MHTFQQTLQNTLLHSIWKKNCLPEDKEVWENKAPEKLLWMRHLSLTLTRWTSSCIKAVIIHPEAINAVPDVDTGHICKETMCWGGREALRDCFPAIAPVSPPPLSHSSANLQPEWLIQAYRLSSHIIYGHWKPNRYGASQIHWAGSKNKQGCSVNLGCCLWYIINI